MKRCFLLLLILTIVAGPLLAGSGVLRMATTTSTENSGLLAWLLPYFEQETGLKVHVIAVGTGKALRLGENGDVDVVLVHARSAEEKFVANGFGLYRKDVMYNDFLLVGPASDPDGLRGVKTAVDAFKRLADGKARFVSRGDDSGTNKKEKQLWQAAGIHPSGLWYVESGQGMGAVLMMASDMQGYTLTDRATYLKMKSKLELVPLFEGDPELFNQYGVIPINPHRHPGINIKAAERFADWITSPKGQQLIGRYGQKEFGHPLFYPNAKSK